MSIFRYWFAQIKWIRDIPTRVRRFRLKFLLVLSETVFANFFPIWNKNENDLRTLGRARFVWHFFCSKRNGFIQIFPISNENENEWHTLVPTANRSEIQHVKKEIFFRACFDIEMTVVLRWKSQRIKVIDFLYIFKSIPYKVWNFSWDFKIHRLIWIFLWIFGCFDCVSSMFSLKLLFILNFTNDVLSNMTFNSHSLYSRHTVNLFYTQRHSQILTFFVGVVFVSYFVSFFISLVVTLLDMAGGLLAPRFFKGQVVKKTLSAKNLKKFLSLLLYLFFLHYASIFFKTI